MGFFACHPAWQRQLLGEMLAASCVDDPAVSGCAGWAASGELSFVVLFCLESAERALRKKCKGTLLLSIFYYLSGPISWLQESAAQTLHFA